MKRTVAVLGVVAAVTAVLAGCTSSDEEAQTVDQLETLLTTVVEPTWTIDVEPIGTTRVPVVDDTAIAYVKTAKADVTLAAYDATNGHVRWMRPASINNRVQGVLSPMFTERDDRPLLASVGAPVSQPNATWTSDLALLDPRTGKVKAASSGLWVQSIWDCGVDGGVCFWANTPGVDDAARYQLTVDGGVQPYRSSSSVPGYADSRDLAGDVWGVANKAGEQFVIRVVNGAKVWKIPATDVVGADGEVIDSLGAWYASEDEGIFFFNSTGVKAPDTYVVTAAEQRAGAIDLETGAVLWRANGEVMCGGADEWRLLCSGEFSFRRDVAADAPELDTGDVTMRRVDGRTGATTWELNVADFSGLTNFELGPQLHGFGGYGVLRSAEEILIIDLATGEATNLSGNQTIACSVPTKASFKEFSIPTNRTISEVTGSAIQSCTAEGTSSDPSTFTQAVVLGPSGGALVDGEWKYGEDAPVHVVRTEDALLGYVG